MFIFNIFVNISQKWGGEITIFGKVVAVLEVDDGDFGINGSGFSLLVKLNEALFGFSKMIIDNIWSSGAEDTRYFTTTCDKTSQA